MADIQSLVKQIVKAAQAAERAIIFAGEATRTAVVCERNGDFENAAQHRADSLDHLSIHEYENNRMQELITQLGDCHE